MLKEVLVLFSQDIYEDGQAPYRNHPKLLEESQGSDHKVSYYYGILKELIFTHDGSDLSVTEPRSGRDIASFDLVFFQKWSFAPQHAFAAAIYLDFKKTDFFSREILHQNAFSKLTEMMLLVSNGLPYPKTVIASLAKLEELTKDAKPPFTYPMVLKSTDGTRGQNNYLIKNDSEFAAFAGNPKLSGLLFMLQEYIPNDCDYRLTVMGGELEYVLRRTRAKGTHLNNTSQGGQGEFVPPNELPAGVIEDAVKAARAVYREDFAGVDVVIGKNDEHWILEVNKSPEIQTGFKAEYKTKLLAGYIARRLSL